MKKYIRIAFAYAVAAMAGGVFYREFTKFSGYWEGTALGKVHTHLFMLGTFVFLLVALFCRETEIERTKTFRAFFCVYNIGVPLTSAMLLARGVAQVTELPLSNGASAALSGLAGLGHILTGTGLVLLFMSLLSSNS